MSPVPLIARQRALSRIGEIRCGDEKHDGKVGRKLDTFRLTSQHKDILERAAELYGGEVKEWESPTGQAWQLITTRSSLPVLVIPGYSLKRSYEKWNGPSKRERTCDGEEQSNGEACICNAQGKDECKLLTRLMVLLPETGTSLGWQLSSTGETAADELELAMTIAKGISNGNPFVPGTLSLTQRKGQLNGQATRFVVPVLGFNPALTLVAGELSAGQGALGHSPSAPALPAGFTPIEHSVKANGNTLAEGLAEAESQEVKRTARSAVPIPEDDDVLDQDAGEPHGSEAAPSPLGGDVDAVSSAGTDESPAKPLTIEEAKKKLNAMVGQLRDGGHITTQQLWARVASMREVPALGLVQELDGVDPEGVLHWAPLRDSLNRAEANELRDRLAGLWVAVQNEAS